MRLLLLIFTFFQIPNLVAQTIAPKHDSIFIQLETKLWELYKLKDSKSLDRYIAPDFYDVLLDGTMQNRKEWFTDMLKTDVIDYQLKDFRVVILTKKSSIIYYTAESHGSQNGHSGFNKVWVTSAWAKRKSKWMNIFYRENRIPDKPAGK